MTFTTEAERQRARRCAKEMLQGTNAGEELRLLERFDRLYPPVVDAPGSYDRTALYDHGLIVKEQPTPSPAFAAAVRQSENANYYRDPDEIVAARAALVRCHLEEVNDGR